MGSNLLFRGCSFRWLSFMVTVKDAITEYWYKYSKGEDVQNVILNLYATGFMQVNRRGNNKKKYLTKFFVLCRIFRAGLRSFTKI